MTQKDLAFTETKELSCDRISKILGLRPLTYINIFK